MSITQKKIAEALSISDARLSQILSGEEPGKKTAYKMGEYTGLPWHIFIEMDRKKMRETLFAVGSANQEGPLE